jgi:pimeloyl-ACP methyl ester carboxylesterase
MRRAALAPEDRLPNLPGVLPAWPGESVVLDGSVTFVRRTPPTAKHAEPALYVHGLGGSSLNWTDLAYLLAGQFDGEAIDLPGFGFSDPGRRYGLPDAAARVVRWIESSERGPVHLVGNSLGGTIAIRVAATRPELVRTLTVVSPAMPFFDPRRSLQSRLLPVLLIPGGERLVARKLATIPPEALAQQVIEACFADPTALPEERLAEAIEEVRRRYVAPWYVAAYLRTLRGLVTSFLRAYLPGDNSMWRMAARVVAPTLVIGGRNDRLVDIRVVPAVAQLVPDSRLMMLDRVGHVAQMEQPRLVARGILALLEEARSADRVHETQPTRTVALRRLARDPARA